MTALKLTRLMNADDETVGYFSDYAVEMAARKEWNTYYQGKFGYGSAAEPCRSVETYITPAELENVDAGDGDRVEYLLDQDLVQPSYASRRVGQRIELWSVGGAAAVEVQRFFINKYRRPNLSNRDADLGGPAEAAGVLYVLRVKAPKV